MMDTGEQEILNEFISETKEHLDSIEDDFLNLEKQKDNPDRELVDKIFRAIHSIKGAAGFLGFNRMKELTHTMETLLDMVRKGEMIPNSSLIDALLAGVDIINTMVDDIEHSNEIDISVANNRLADHLNPPPASRPRNQIKTKLLVYNSEDNKNAGFEINGFRLNNIPGNRQLYVLRYSLGDFRKIQDKNLTDVLLQLEKTGEIIAIRPVSSDKDIENKVHTLEYEVLYSTVIDDDCIQELSGLPWEKIRKPDISGGEDAKPVDYENCESVDLTSHNYDNDMAPQTADIETSAYMQDDECPITGSDHSQEKAVVCVQDANSQERNNSIRIHVNLLDELMTLAGELVLVRNQQLRNIDGADPVTQAISQRLDIVTSDLQETIMRTRMQPIGNVFGKLPRIVRDLNKKLGKKIEIATFGNEVELDKTILESLADPLTHLIRNCCDHGIESSEDRETEGKPSAGKIEVIARHEAGQINILIKDDGRGIDPDLIIKKALENNLKTEEELSRMSKKEILSLIFMSGFSTAKTISDVSGRGVGMDVVKTSIEQLGGSLEIESAKGKGTVIFLRLPLTLAIIPCLVVKVGDNRYAIPQVNLEELVSLYDDDVFSKIERAGDQEVYRLRNQLLPMVRLNEVLNRPEKFSRKTQRAISEIYRLSNSQQIDSGPDSLVFAVVKIGTRKFGLIVDQVIGTEEIVVKPMHPAIKSLDIYSGATVMGDGKVALILDIEGIARHSSVVFGVSDEENEEDSKRKKSVDDNQNVFLFRSGKTEQFAVALPLIKRVEKIRLSDIEKVGDKEFVTIGDISVRIIRLENALSVSPCVEKEEMFLLLPKHIKQPFGILVSEIVDISIAPSFLNTESYMEDGIVGTALINESMTLFLEIIRVIEKAEPDLFSKARGGAYSSDNKTKILLAEDNRFFRHLVKEYIEADNYDVIDAEDGEEALALMHSDDVDLIVSDIEMPKMDGFTFMENVRKEDQFQDIPSIALTSLEGEIPKNKALDAGFDSFQNKLDRDILLTEISGLIDKNKNKE